MRDCSITLSLMECIQYVVCWLNTVFISEGATTVEKGGVDSLTLHVGILGVSGLAMSLFPFYRGPVSL